MTLKRCFLFIAFCLVPTSLFSNKLYFPQVVFGGGYTTTIVLMNKGMTSVSSDFQVYGETGTLLKSIPVTVHGLGSTRLSIADPAPSIVSSWGMLDAGTETCAVLRVMAYLILVAVQRLATNPYCCA
jgi:hypothetical protein